MSRPLPKAILLDLDDTILAYGSVSNKCWQDVCQRFEGRIENVGVDQLLDTLKSTSRWFWSDPERHRRGRLRMINPIQEVVSKALNGLGVVDKKLAEELSDSYSKIRETSVTPFPGAIETVKRLGDDGIGLALITNGNKEAQRSKIDRFGLGPLFNYILVEGEFGVGKPDQRVYRHALEQLDASAAETWMVGDNLEWDVGGPQKLGITGIWVNPRGDGPPETAKVRPDRIITSLTELL